MRTLLEMYAGGWVKRPETVPRAAALVREYIARIVE